VARLSALVQSAFRLTSLPHRDCALRALLLGNEALFLFDAPPTRARPLALWLAASPSFELVRSVMRQTPP